MKAWITKYATTQGIFQIEAEVATTCPDMIVDKENRMSIFHGEGRDWHRTHESAVKRANELVATKIKSLEKQLARLKIMNFI